MSRLDPKSIKARSQQWDSRMVELIDLIVHLDYRVKDIANHFDCHHAAVRSVLYRRTMSLNRLKYDFANGKDVYNWRKK